jgi:serine/tyrosine/threonine adenylyltransferase
MTPPSATSLKLFAFNTTYTQLPALLYQRQRPTPVANPAMVTYNHALAEDLQLASITDTTQLAALLAGNALADGADPIAQAYAGHQFGHFTMLGDGRALLLGEHVTPTGQRWDVQFKGSGPTAFSRRGDGRAALGPMLREYIISEAMHALGIQTTRSLAVVSTGEPVYRDEPLPGAVLTRIAASHIRVGTFQYAAQEANLLSELADYTMQRHYPELFTTADDRYLAFLHAVVRRQAQLIAQWMHVGFIHGVMNTDNMTLSGETIDYGPCAFMDAYNPKTVFSSIDRQGRYAYGNQPGIAQWNLARLAETVLPLLHPEPATATALATDAAEQFGPAFQTHWLTGMRKKLGLTTTQPADEALILELLTLMNEHQADYTNTFRQLPEVMTQPHTALFQTPDFVAWHTRWRQRVSEQPEPWDTIKALMDAHNPAVIPRNHQVEAVLEAATMANDLKPLHQLLQVLATPYSQTPLTETYQQPAPVSAIPYKTFCGT